MSEKFSNIVRFKKGQKIVSIGDVLDYVGSVKEGIVRFHRPNQGREVSLLNMKMFYEWSAMMAITGDKSKVVAEAMTVVEMTKTPKSDFIKEITTDPNQNAIFLQKISKMFLDLMDKHINIVGASAIGKVAAVILATNGEKYPLTHKLIASLTGLTRETVTLQMLKLEKLKIVDNANRKVKILDKKKLEKLIG